MAAVPAGLGAPLGLGALSNISNPKIAVFYFAFLPQFVQPGASHPTLSILALYRGSGLVMIGLALRLALARRGG